MKSCKNIGNLRVLLTVMFTVAAALKYKVPKQGNHLNPKEKGQSQIWGKYLFFLPYLLEQSEQKEKYLNKLTCFL